jgi:hypothetical protein
MLCRHWWQCSPLLPGFERGRRPGDSCISSGLFFCSSIPSSRMFGLSDPLLPKGKDNVSQSRKSASTWATRVSHGSAPFIATFLMIHLTPPVMANLGGSSLASQVMVSLCLLTEIGGFLKALDRYLEENTTKPRLAKSCSYSRLLRFMSQQVLPSVCYTFLHRGLIRLLCMRTLPSNLPRCHLARYARSRLCFRSPAMRSYRWS